MPLQAYLALLQAHAHFATAGKAELDAESRQVVVSAQEPHYRYSLPVSINVTPLDEHVLGAYAQRQQQLMICTAICMPHDANFEVL